MRHPAFLIPLFLAAALSLAAATPCQPLTLIPALLAPAPGDVYLHEASADCTTIQVEVAGRDLANVFTLSFDVRYPIGLLTYDGYVIAPTLLHGSPRTPPLVLVQKRPTGVLQISMTRFAPDGGVSFGGEKGLLTLRFHRIGTGTGTIDFNQNVDSFVTEKVVSDSGVPVAARFGPGHGITFSTQ